MGQRCSNPGKYIPILQKMIVRSAEILGQNVPNLPEEKDPCDTLTKLELIYRNLIASGLKSCANPIDKLSPEQLFLLADDSKIYCVSAEEIPGFFGQEINPYTNKKITEELRNELELIYQLYMADSYYEARSKYDYLLCLDRKNRPAGQYSSNLFVDTKNWLTALSIRANITPERNGDIYQAAFYYYHRLIAGNSPLLRVDGSEQMAHRYCAAACLSIAAKFYGSNEMDRDIFFKEVGMESAVCTKMEVDILIELDWNIIVATTRAFASLSIRPENAASERSNELFNEIDRLVVWSIVYGMNYPANILTEAASLIAWNQVGTMPIYEEESVRCANEMAAILHANGIKKFKTQPSAYKIIDKPARGNWETCRPGRLLHRREYKKQAALGAGSYGSVYSAIGSSGQVVAVKQFFFQPESWDTTIREISLLKELNHPNIVRLYDVQVTPSESGGIEITQIMEKMAGPLSEKISRRAKLNLATRREIMRQLLTGLRYCHFRNIAHRDLKPANILFEGNTYKLADFGWGRMVNAIGDNLTPDVCTTRYRPPELFSDEKNVSYDPFAVDIWGAGCIMGALVRGRSLFAGDGVNDILLILRTIPMSKKDWTEMKQKYWPKSLQDFQQQIMPPPLAEQFAEMDANELDLFSRLLTINPTKRITAEQALQHPYFEPR